MAEIKETKELATINTNTLLEKVVFTESTEGYTREEVNGVVIERLEIGQYDNGNPIALTDPKVIAMVRLVRSLNDMDDRSKKVRCSILSEMRKGESHKKAGVRSFGEFASMTFPQYDSKTLGIWANVGDTFYVPVVDNDGKIIDITERYTAFRDFQVSKLQQLLGVVNDESLGINCLIEDVAAGKLYAAMTLEEVKKYVKTLRNPVNDDPDGKDGKDGGKDGKDGGKFDASRADNMELISYLNDVAATLKLTLAVVESRCADEKPLATDDFTIKAFKGLATGVKCYLNKINKLVILDSEEVPETGKEAPENGEN